MGQRSWRAAGRAEARAGLLKDQKAKALRAQGGGWRPGGWLLGLVCLLFVIQAEATHEDHLEDGYCQGTRAHYTCCPGERGLILPIIKFEAETWSRGVRATLYLITLIWCFLGVSVLSDTFMAAIEHITNATYKKKVMRITKDGQPERDSAGNPIFDEVDEVYWNPSVANLTLMALGSSTPEILLSMIEIFLTNNFYAGDLGPGTVVGSAAFNLYMITAMCMVALAPGELRRIEGFTVYIITAFHSVFAYAWLVVILVWVSPDVVEIWEALITFLMMPWLVAWVYCADKNWFRESKVAPEEGGEAPASIEEEGGENKETTAGQDETAAAKDAWRNQAPTSSSSEANRRSSVQSENGLERTPSSGSGPGGDGGSSKKNTYMSYRRQMVASTTGASKHRARLPSLRDDDPEREHKIAMHESFNVTSYSMYHWEKASYSFYETMGHAKLTVIRHGKISASGKVTYATHDGSAKHGETYVEKSGIVEFKPGEQEKSVFVPLIHDYEWKKDLDFMVTLSPADHEGKIDPRSSRTTVTVIDQDKAGTFAWSKITPTDFVSTDSAATLVMERRQGLQSQSCVKVRTRDGSAQGGVHFESLEANVDWKVAETSKLVKIKLIPFSEPEEYENPEDKAVRFFVDLQELVNGEVTGETHTADIKLTFNPTGKASKTEDGEEEEEDAPPLTWAEQFKQAMNVNAGGDLGEASVTDCIMHFLSIGWKVFAAIVPPVHYLGGWACFWCALMLVGVITAFIGDLASIFGCLVGLEDTTTAITVVALGTSVPDTFASVLAIRSDETADNAIGNVTGSNSVNVFLGLGFPWLVAALYWQVKGPSDEWKERYRNWQYFDDYKDTGGFVVEANSLGFNTTLFSILTIFAFLVLYIRRLYFGGELGGPTWGNWASAGTFASLWFIYIVVSALQAANPDDIGF